MLTITCVERTCHTLRQPTKQTALAYQCVPGHEQGWNPKPVGKVSQLSTKEDDILVEERFVQSYGSCTREKGARSMTGQVREKETYCFSNARGYRNLVALS